MTKPVSALTHVRLVAEDLMLLIEQEIKLAKQEINSKIDQAYSGLVMAIAGLLAAFVAVGVLVQALVAGLATTMPLWAAAAAVGAAFLFIAAMLLMVAKSRLAPENLAPVRTVDSIARSARTVKENIK